MPSYSYTAVNTVGKVVRSTIEAPSPEMAKNSLRRSGLTLYELKKTSVMETDLNIPFLGRPKAKDMAIYWSSRRKTSSWLTPWGRST